MKKSKNCNKTNLTGNRVRRISFVLLGSAFLLALLFSNNVFAQECTKKGTVEKQTSEKLLYNNIRKGDLQKVKELIDQDENLVNVRMKKEETPIIVATYKGHYNIVEYLISKNANIEARGNSSNTPFILAAKKGKVKIAKLLLDNGAQKNAIGSYGNTAMHFATLKSRENAVKFLIENDCKFDTENDYGQTPLTYASWFGNTEIIKTLVNNGANVNHVASENNTVSHNLARGGYTEGIAIVLEAGANVNISDDNGQLPIHCAIINGKPEALKALIKSTENLNAKEKYFGNTALHIAAINGDLKSFQTLVDAGADYNQVNNKNQKPIDYAVKYGNTDLVSNEIPANIASKKLLKLAEENKKACSQKTEVGNANVYYCGHSGWAVNTENSVLIFDYWGTNKITDNPSLSNGSICPKELKDKKVFVFVSHDHGDHYDTTIYSWQKEIKDITYIYGFVPEKSGRHKKTGYHGPDYVYIKDNQSEKVGNLKITTLKSNDTGQGFLVEADGVSIYHPGDHALFTEKDKPGYVKEVDFIASQNNKIDIAFLPVTGCPSRWKKEFIVEGFFYSIDKLNPTQVFPMHALNREYKLYEFAELAKERKSNANILCAENCGDNFSYNQTITAEK